MQRKWARLATRVSWFCVFGVIISNGCASNEEPSLAGPVACGSTTCGGGQICVEDEHDLGPGSANPMYYETCIAPTAGCSLAPCGNANDPACAQCVVDMCTPYAGKAGLHDRTLSCVSF
jgi:hypothetical protein